MSRIVAGVRTRRGLRALLVSLAVLAAATVGFVVARQVGTAARQVGTTARQTATATGQLRSASPGPPPAPGPSPATPSAVLGATASPLPNQPNLPTTRATAAPPAAAAVSALIAPALHAVELGPSVRALVVDATGGTALYSHSATGSAPPGSTAKLATAAAVLQVRTPTDRFTTRAVAGSRPGQVVLVGGGDPTLSAARGGAPTRYDGAARLSDLAAQVRAATGVPITSIVVDGSLFRGPREAPGWADEDVPSDYASDVTALMVDGGRPASGGELRSKQPELEAGRAFAQLLGRPSATISSGPAPAGAAALGTVRSAPVLDLVEQMLKNSDNVVAEMLARQVALALRRTASFAGATAAVRAALAPVGVALPATLSDGSGLSQRDRLTPALLVALLRVVLDGRHPRLAPLVEALPVAGWDGTLAPPRYRGAAARAGAGVVRAKTGTLTGVVTLAGLVRDRDGRVLVFALMADRVPPDGTAAAEAALDAVAGRLATCGCR